METKDLLKWTISLVAVFVIQHATATNTAAQLPDSAYRVKYEHTKSMPDHVAYLTLMRDLVDTERQGGHAANIKDIQDHMSLDRDHAELFLQFLLSSYTQLISINRAVTNRMLCNADMPKYNANQASQVLDALDDIKETNLAKYYHHAQVNLGTYTASELSTWLADVKMQSPQSKRGHRAFLHSGENVEKVIGRACNIIATYEPQASAPLAVDQPLVPTGQ